MKNLKVIITLILMSLTFATYADDKSIGNVFVSYDRPIPMCRKAIKDGSDHNKQIPKPEKKPWNGND